MLLITTLKAFITHLLRADAALSGLRCSSSFRWHQHFIDGPMVDIKNLIMMKHQFKHNCWSLRRNRKSWVTIIYTNLLLGWFIICVFLISWVLSSRHVLTEGFWQSSTSTCFYPTPTWPTFPWAAFLYPCCSSTHRLDEADEGSSWLCQVRVAKVANIVLLAFPVLTGLLVNQRMPYQ